jgi:hypothetical protein
VDCLKALRRGDTLLVWKLDRPGRSLRHLVNTVHDLTLRGIGFKVLTGHGATIDTTTPSGKLVFGFFAALAEYERELIVERTRVGLAPVSLWNSIPACSALYPLPVRSRVLSISNQSLSTLLRQLIVILEHGRVCRARRIESGIQFEVKVLRSEGMALFASSARVHVLYKRPAIPAKTSVPAIAVSVTYRKQERVVNPGSTPVSATNALRINHLQKGMYRLGTGTFAPKSSSRLESLKSAAAAVGTGLDRKLGPRS